MLKNIRTASLVSGIVVTITALGLRLIALWQLATANGAKNPVHSPSKLSDMATYWQLSGEIVNGSFTGEFYYQPFYYAVFLPILRLLGCSQVGVGVVQALLGATTVFLVWWIGKKVYSSKCGVIAALLTACCAPLILYTPYLIIANIQAFWLILITLLGLNLLQSNNKKTLFLLAVALGCAILTRGNAYYLLPAVFGLCFVAYKRKAIWSILLILLVIAIIQLPFIVHNSKFNGELTGPSTASAPVLTLGNTPEAPPGGREFNSSAGAMEYPPSYDVWMNSIDSISVWERIFGWFKAEPLAFMELQLRKLLLFWDWRDIPNNVALFGEGAASFVIHLHWTTGILLTLGLTGILLLAYSAVRKRNYATLWLLYIILGYWAATAAFYNLSRFRAPILPVLAIIGAMGLLELFKQFNSNRNLFYAKLSALIIALFVVFYSFDFYTQNLESRVMKVVRPDGTHTANMVLDNGPVTMGGWREYPLAYGQVIHKKFANVAPQFAGEVELGFYVQTPPQNVSFKLNGKEINLRLDKVFSTEKFPITNSDLIIESRSNNLFLIVDDHRNYQRTLVNNQPINSELVARLIYSTLTKE